MGQIGTEPNLVRMSKLGVRSTQPAYNPFSVDVQFGIREGMGCACACLLPDGMHAFTTAVELPMQKQSRLCKDMSEFTATVINEKMDGLNTPTLMPLCL
jgi:hypothetical protein